MNPQSNHIQDLLDGELDPMHESRLFGELAISADLRTEFRQQMAIRNAVQQDRAALVPPIALTSSVFSGLGFAAPLAGAAAGAASGGFLLSWLTRIGLPLLSSVAAAGITYTAINSSNTTVQQPTAPQTSLTPKTAAAAGESDAPPGISNAELSELANLRSQNKALQRRLAATSQQRFTQPAQVEQQEEEPAQPPVFVEQPPVVERIEMSNTMVFSPASEPRMMQTTALAPATISFMKYPSFLVQLRGISATALTDVNAPEQTAWYDNVSVGLLYQLSESNAIGMEVGSEAFPMSFQGNQNGQTILYEQQPQAMWAGILYRHTLPTIGATAFAPFGQALVGGSKFGPLGRATLGLAYAPSGPLSFVFGIEGTAMAFQFDNVWNTSTKLGLTYGLAVRF